MMNTTSYPNSAELHYEAQSLVSGIYYIIFKLGDYIHAEEFIK